MPAPVIAATAARTAGAGAARAGAGRAATGKATGKAAGKAATSAAQQAAGIQAIKDARPPAPVVDEDQGDAGKNSGGGRQLPSITVNTGGGTGGGLALGALCYVVGITYLRGGKPAVKRLIRAKFLNDVMP